MSSLTDFETGTFVNFLSHKFALAQEKSNELLFLLVENKKKSPNENACLWTSHRHGMCIGYVGEVWQQAWRNASAKHHIKFSIMCWDVLIDGRRLSIQIECFEYLAFVVYL